MKLYSPEFERNLRRGAKAAIRASPELRKEYRRVRRAPRGSWRPPLYRGFVTLIILAGVLFLHDGGHPLATALAWITYCAATSVFYHARFLESAFKSQNRDVFPLRLLPISEEAIFRFQWSKIIPWKIKPSFDILAAFAVIAACLHFPWLQWLVLPFLAVLVWLLIISLAVICRTRLPAKLCSSLYSAFIGAGLVAYFAHESKTFLAWVDQLAPTVNTVVPTGWAVSLLQLLLPGRQWGTLVLLIPIALVVWVAWQSLPLLRAALEYRETVLPDFPDLIPGDKSYNAINAAETARRAGPTEIEQFIESGAFLCAAPAANFKWLDRWLWAWLSPRERILCDFAFPSGPALNAWTFRFLKYLAISASAGVAFVITEYFFGSHGQASSLFGYIQFIIGVTAAVPLFIAFVQVLGGLTAVGLAFAPVRNVGVLIPIYAWYNIGYLELSRMFLKCSAVQLIVYLPACVLICGGVLTATGVHWLIAFPIGLKAGLLIFAMRFLSTASSFSRFTSGASRLAWRSFLVVFVVLILLVAYVGFGVACLVMPSALLGWAFFFAAVAAAWAFNRFCALIHNIGWFDLIKLPR